MANLKEVRERISSVITTQQITKAMKLVAASKLKKATDNITAMRPYSDKLFSILENILSNVDVDALDLDFGKEREVKNVLIVLATSDKGLCGGFNANLNKKAKALINEQYANLTGGHITIATVCKKWYDFFKSFEGVKLETTYKNLFTDKVHVVYAKFINAATQEYNVEQFLPIAKFEAKEGSMNVDFEFEPDKTDLVKELVPKILKTQFYRFLLDNNASEHGARMVAMDQATENANTLLNDLKLLYNRERQAAITTEILEIVGGAAALEDG